MIHVGIWGYFYSVSTLIITRGLGKWGAQLTGKVLIKGSPLGCLPLFVISFLVWGYEHGRVWARYKAWLQEQRQLQSIRTWVAIRWRGGRKKKKSRPFNEKKFCSGLRLAIWSLPSFLWCLQFKRQPIFQSALLLGILAKVKKNNNSIKRWVKERERKKSQLARFLP